MKVTRIIGIVSLFGLLILVRVYEYIFHDPLLSFFDGDFQQKKLPELDYCSISMSYFFRFLLNSVLSWVIIYLLFLDKKLWKFCVIFYALFFVVIISLFWMSVSIELSNEIIFFIRRFIIQPMLLLILVPAIYFIKHQQKNEKF